MGGFHLNLIQNLPPVYESPPSLPSSTLSPQWLGRAKSNVGASVSSKGTVPPTPDDRIMRTNGPRYPLRHQTVIRVGTHTPNYRPPPTTRHHPCPRHLPPVAAPQVNVSSGWGKASQHLSTFRGFPQTFPLSGLSFTHFSSLYVSSSHFVYTFP